MCACHSSRLSFACCCVPESLYVFPCQWNYRPDHCIYGSNCKEAEQSGVFVLHGNRGVFHDHKQPAFRAVYEAIQKVELVKNFKYTKPCPRAYWLSAWLVQESLRGCDSISSYKVCFSAARHTVWITLFVYGTYLRNRCRLVSRPFTCHYVINRLSGPLLFHYGCFRQPSLNHLNDWNCCLKTVTKFHSFHVALLASSYNLRCLLLNKKHSRVKETNTFG